MHVTAKISAMIIQRMPIHGVPVISRAAGMAIPSRTISLRMRYSAAQRLWYRLGVITLPHAVDAWQPRSFRRGISAATLAVALLLSCSASRLAAQAANESLGPTDSHGKVKGTPLLAEMKTLPSAPKPEVACVHPRLYFTGAEIDALRTKIHTHHAAEWKQELAHLRVFAGDPPPPPAEKRRAQNDVAFAIAEGAFAYAIE